LSLARLCLCDGALELGAGGEPRRAASGDVDRLAGARVARLAGGALGDREPSEPSDHHFAAAGQLGFDRGQRRIDRARGLATRESGAIGDLLDEFALVHPRPPPLDGLAATVRGAPDGIPGAAFDASARSLPRPMCRGCSAVNRRQRRAEPARAGALRQAVRDVLDVNESASAPAGNCATRSPPAPRRRSTDRAISVETPAMG
jgi:hypothetical protein